MRFDISNETSFYAVEKVYNINANNPEEALYILINHIKNNKKSTILKQKCW